MAQNRYEYRVTGMTCGHCEMSVREEVGEIPGIDQIEVSHETGALSFTATQPVPDDAVLAAVQEAGYAATRA
ncbi:heavy metal transporter [Brachybacterium sp. P6-10-X1]|uniref:heavy-metal-associated domain-containing protein n=1 Tax=Brachybacterium sp. P6-10-X1 TaxID=1903186 RepID=UPI000971882D|nr:heavy-metal-associated domain-containing protein [Brachybacterium sp. P6-10-X1]APX33452.1 heavy metal transporter [Brachybacterium sp. P6-10-X1]